MENYTIHAMTDGYGLTRSPVAGLCSNGRLAQAERCATLTLDWSEAGFLSITQMVALTQVAAGVVACEARIQLIDPRPNVKRYVSRMNCYKLLGIGTAEPFQRHDPSHRFIPARRIVTPDDPAEIATSVREMIMSCVDAPGNEVAGFVDISFSEIMDNVINHSMSRTGGIAAGQYYPRMGFVEICVADGGQGIAASMRTNPAYDSVDDSTLVMCALEEGYGQFVGMQAFRDSETSGGMGLTYAKRTAVALGGRMWVVSRAEALEVSAVGTRRLLGLYYPGTLVSLRLPVSGSSTILESQIVTGGRDVPVSWNVDEGIHEVAGGGVGNDVLW